MLKSSNKVWDPRSLNIRKLQLLHPLVEPVDEANTPPHTPPSPTEEGRAEWGERMRSCHCGQSQQPHPHDSEDAPFSALIALYILPQRGISLIFCGTCQRRCHSLLLYRETPDGGKRCPTPAVMTREKYFKIIPDRVRADHFHVTLLWW